MIGVLADSQDHPVIREFFELFKTPWEFGQEGRDYDVLLSSGDRDTGGFKAPLRIIYAENARSPDVAGGVPRQTAVRRLTYRGSELALYCGGCEFPDGIPGLLIDLASHEPALRETRRGNQHGIQVGYDLWSEVRHLLTAGQPAVHASSPALELHIALLRELICCNGVPVIEVPPVPLGYSFTGCLTHDLDHPCIRKHRFDPTMWGFLYRSTIGSALNVLRGRAAVRNLLKNWAAAVKLPFVYVGLAEDFWSEFDRYSQIEGGSPSSFFAIPFKDKPGHACRRQGVAPRRRGAAYGAAEIAPQLQQLTKTGCEVGLHGIDAWADSAQGREELNEIRAITGAAEIGVRMHWLFLDENSPKALEEAGASYDSTVGYNETIGFRAGTTQVYRHLNTISLLELPLNIMDTALFYPSYLHLSPRDASLRIRKVVESAVQHGGCITVNWHDRSIAPERLWDTTYIELLNEMKSQGAWLTTAAQAVAWFRQRRTAVFEREEWRAESLRVSVSLQENAAVPGLRLRAYPAQERRRPGENRSLIFRELPLQHSIDTRLDFSNPQLRRSDSKGLAAGGTALELLTGSGARPSAGPERN